jgi:hypothetical protein
VSSPCPAISAPIVSSTGAFRPSRPLAAQGGSALVCPRPALALRPRRNFPGTAGKVLG